jgi:hypothetical protein
VDFSRYVEWIKLSPRYLLPISLFTGFVLFAPQEMLDRFGLVRLLSDYRPYFGLVFLLSTTLLLSAALAAVYSWFKKRRRQRARLKYMRQRLHHLAEPEKVILRGFVYNGTRSQYLDMADGTIGGLEVEGIIFRSSNVGNINSWAYNIQPWAWRYLTSHPDLLAIDDVEAARALLLNRARLAPDIDLIDEEHVEDAYRIARDKVERDRFAHPHERRVLEEARQLLLKSSARRKR